MGLTFGDILLYVTVFFGLFTSIFFLLTLVEFVPRERRHKMKGYEKVCIIVPCYNEEGTVGKTVESLLAMDYPKDKLEIVVVDDGSTDNTYRIAKRYEKEGVLIYRKKNGGKHTALNYALKRTDAAYVGALDADSFVHPQALKRMMPHFQKQRVIAVTPSMKIHEPKTWLQHVQWTEYLLGIFLRKVFTYLGAQHVTPGPFSIYKKEFFEKHGYYRPAHNTEDIEIALRIQANNYEIDNAHDAYVYTVGPARWKGLWNQRIRWYHGFVRNIEDYSYLFHPSHGHLGIFVLPGSFFSVALVMAGVVYTMTRVLANWWDKIIYLQATGWDLAQWEFSFDTFFISFSSTIILGWIALLLGVLVILIARQIADEKHILKHYLWFLVTYWILFGLWWIGALWKRLTKSKVTWKHKSEM